MAYTAHPTVVTGQTWTASNQNTYVRDNFSAIWQGTTAGDLDYYTAATTKTRLGIGTAYSILNSTGTAPAWLAKGSNWDILRINASGVLEWGTIATVLAASPMVSSQAAEDLFVGSSATAIKRLAKGTNWYGLRVNGSGVLEWGTPATQFAQIGIVASQAAGDIITASSANAISRLANPTNASILRNPNTGPAYYDISTAPLGILRSNATGADVELAPIGKKCIVYSSSNRTVAGGTITTINMNAEVVDDGNWHDTVTNNNRITVDEAGWYLASAQARISHSGTDPYCRLYIRYNGTTTYIARDGNWGFGGYAVELNAVGKPYYLNAGDYVDMALESVAGDRTMDSGVSNNWLSLVRMQ